MKTLTSKQYILLCEALRRYIRFGKFDGKSLDSAWTGLGTVTEYKSVLNSGMMEWIHGEPVKRCMGWLRLTPLGVRIVQKWMDNGFTELKSDSNGWDIVVNSEGFAPSWSVEF